MLRALFLCIDTTTPLIGVVDDADASSLFIKSLATGILKTDKPHKKEVCGTCRAIDTHRISHTQKSGCGQIRLSRNANFLCVAPSETQQRDLHRQDMITAK